MATPATTVAAGWLEIEAGAEVDRYADRSRGMFAPVLLKLGLAPTLQLSVQIPLVRPAATNTTDLGDLSVGLKWRFKEQGLIVGDLAILPSVKIPSGSVSSGAGTSTTDVNLLVISSHEVGAVAVDFNAGYSRRSGDGTLAPRQQSLWAASIGGPAAGRLGFVAEVFGYPATSGPAGAESIVAILGGPTVQVRERLVLDAGFIAPIRGPQPRAMYIGVVYNVGQAWRR